MGTGQCEQDCTDFPHSGGLTLGKSRQRHEFLHGVARSGWMEFLNKVSTRIKKTMI
jgi:hypothetical protein